MGDLLRETVRSIRAHALRFALTSSGIVWGVAMLTYLSATMDGYDQHFAAQIDKVGQRIVFLFPGSVTKPHVGQRGARRVELEIEDVERLPTLDSIDRAAVNLWAGPRMFRAGRRTKLIWTWGASEQTAAIRAITAAKGRMLTRQDVEGEARVVFLGAKAARRLFGDRPALGRSVHIDSIPFRVIGVSTEKGDQLLSVGPLDDEIALLPVTTVQRWFTKNEEVHDIIFSPRTREISSEAVASARALLGLHHGFRPDDDTAMGYFNIQDAMDIVVNLLLGLRIFLSAASLITLGVGAVGVMNIMLVVVTERTKEIGLRKAIGASNREIFTQFLAETLMVTLLAGALGALLGSLAVLATGWLMGTGETMRATPVLELRAVLGVFATLAIVGTASGLLPALRASGIDPATSLRAT